MLVAAVVVACAAHAGPPTSEPVPRFDPAPLPVDAAEPEEPGALDATALAEWTTSIHGLDAMIHPEHGIFVIHNISGSLRHIDLLHRWPDEEETMIGGLLVEQDVLDQLRRAPVWPDEYRAPGTEDECDPGSASLYDDSSPTWWVLDVHLGMRESHDEEADEMAETGPPWIERPYEALDASRLPEIASSHWDTQWTEHDWMRLRILDGATQRAAFMGDVALYFGVIDGRWYLTGINATDDACG